MSAIIAAGALWRHFAPFGLDSGHLRRLLTRSVYYLFLPALVLKVLWHAPINVDSLRISATAVSGVIFALVITRLMYRLFTVDRPTLGAMLLAASFPNVTYMGLPVLTALYGDWAGSVAIQYDLFGTTPLLFTLGIAIASRFGADGESRFDVSEILRVPALWAAMLAILLHFAAIAPNAAADKVLGLLSVPVVPIMLFAIGLSLSWQHLRRHRLPLLIPVVLVQFLALPLFAWGLAGSLGLRGEWLDAVVLEAAMPCMVLGIVLCDRYGLDSALYAAAVTLTTVASLGVIPLWYSLLA